MRQFEGQIRKDQIPHYVPPSGARAPWTNREEFTIEQKEPWRNFADIDGFYKRYGGGLQNKGRLAGLGLSIHAQERMGGLAYLILKKLYEKHGISVLPTDQEWTDFACANSKDRRPLGIEDYEGLTGEEWPFKRTEGTRRAPHPVHEPELHQLGVFVHGGKPVEIDGQFYRNDVSLSGRNLPKLPRPNKFYDTTAQSTILGTGVVDSREDLEKAVSHLKEVEVLLQKIKGQR